MKICYEPTNFRADTLAIIETANEIIDDYAADGYTLTLRQLYYQFVARNLIENTERSYKKLGNHITKGRMAGLVSWRAIEDRTRSAKVPWFQESEEDVLSGIEYGISFDQWARQEHYVEVWVEKEALSAVVARPCDALDVAHLACKGYLSASEAWRSGMRFLKAANDGKKCVLFHLGDHDPSGIDMTRDNGDRLDIFAEFNVRVERLALNMDQVEQYNPPSNPTKITDSRAAGYLERFGHTSWELDALEPKVIDDLVTNAIEPLIDRDIWNEVFEEEQEAKHALRALGNNWTVVREFLDSNGYIEGE